jgi:hypothetical protein
MDERGRTATGDIGRYHHAVSEHPVEYGVRLTAAAIGLSLLALTLTQLSKPQLAREAVALVQSATGQWLAVVAFAFVLIGSALYGVTPDS